MAAPCETATPTVAEALVGQTAERLLALVRPQPGDVGEDTLPISPEASQVLEVESFLASWSVLGLTDEGTAAHPTGSPMTLLLQTVVERLLLLDRSLAAEVAAVRGERPAWVRAVAADARLGGGTLLQTLAVTGARESTGGVRRRWEALLEHFVPGEDGRTRWDAQLRLRRTELEAAEAPARWSELQEALGAVGAQVPRRSAEELEGGAEREDRGEGPEAGGEVVQGSFPGRPPRAAEAGVGRTWTAPRLLALAAAFVAGVGLTSLLQRDALRVTGLEDGGPAVRMKGEETGLSVLLDDGAGGQEVCVPGGAPCPWRPASQALLLYYRLEELSAKRHLLVFALASDGRLIPLYPERGGRFDSWLSGRPQPTSARPECPEGLCQLDAGGRYPPKRIPPGPLRIVATFWHGGVERLFGSADNDVHVVDLLVEGGP